MACLEVQTVSCFDVLTWKYVYSSLDDTDRLGHLESVFHREVCRCVGQQGAKQGLNNVPQYCASPATFLLSGKNKKKMKNK